MNCNTNDIDNDKRKCCKEKEEKTSRSTFRVKFRNT